MAVKTVSTKSRRLGDERGQTILLTAVFMTALLGMAALAVDLGHWYKEQRALQARVDAAALAGAQDLPYDVAAANTDASTYASKNGGAVAGETITISQTSKPNDTITVDANRNTQTFFAKTFGISSVSVKAHAVATANLLGEAQYVAPIVVNKNHPKLAGPGCPCFGSTNLTTLPLATTGAPGAFDLLNLDNAHGGNGGPTTLADWILNGFDGLLDLGDYYSNTGVKWNSSVIHDALQARLGSTLLFPVYDSIVGTGSNATYHVIGWVGFTITDFDARSSSGSITGYFTTVVWQGLPAPSNSGEPDYGVRTIRLSG